MSQTFTRQKTPVMPLPKRASESSRLVAAPTIPLYDIISATSPQQKPKHKQRPKTQQKSQVTDQQIKKQPIPETVTYIVTPTPAANNIHIASNPQTVDQTHQTPIATFNQNEQSSVDNDKPEQTSPLLPLEIPELPPLPLLPLPNNLKPVTSIIRDRLSTKRTLQQETSTVSSQPTPTPTPISSVVSDHSTVNFVSPTNPILPDTIPCLMRIRDLEKKYYMGKSEVPVLKGINLDVRTGELLSVVGKSGCGKSTLLHLLATLDIPDKGTIQLEGERIDNLPARQRDMLRNRFIGMIFQFYHLLPELTTLENVLTPIMVRESVLKYFINRRRYIKQATELLKRLGLGHRLKHKPSALSGGEMQRVSIARALIAEPKVLLADEPTGNLDAASAQEILTLLRELNKEQNLTIVMVTHDQTIAATADRTIKIIDGKI